jgi:hypothetical protein
MERHRERYSRRDILETDGKETEENKQREQIKRKRQRGET